MNKHVPSLDRCQKMKELGIEFPDAFFWYYHDSAKPVPINRIFVTTLAENAVPAPLVSEMLEVTPKIGRYRCAVIKGDAGFVVGYIDLDGDFKDDPFLSKNPSNALADLLIYLKENNHI